MATPAGATASATKDGSPALSRKPVAIKQEGKQESKPEIKQEPKDEPTPPDRRAPEVDEFAPNQKGASGVPLVEQRAQLSERIARFEQRVAREPWDTEAWTAMFIEAQGKDVEVARAVYEKFLKQFPTAGRYWKYYVEHELARGNLDRVDNLFSRSLLKCHNIDLWRTYIAYLRSTPKDGKERGRDEITRGFEFALEHVGLDISATPIWSEYLSWVRSWKPTNQYEEGQKINAQRRLYQRAVENPMHNLEGIWKDYDAFENDLNKQLAKELLHQYAGRYMGARSSYRERKRYYEGIMRNMLARPRPAVLSEKDEHQVYLWRRLIDYEKGNPQRLESVPFYNRVVFTYNQCLLCLYHYPEIWHDFARFQAEQQKWDHAIATYNRALEPLSKCLLLHFALADLHEERKNLKEAQETYERALTTCPETLVYIQYMKYARRNLGVKEARSIFKRGRALTGVTYHLYVASALMEWQINKQTDVARNVFEFGAKHFSDNPAFMLEFLRFLMHFNEESQIRVLFERAVATGTPEQLHDIWRLWIEFEYSYGDAPSCRKIEQRYRTVYPKEDPTGITAAVYRHRYMDLWPVNVEELQSFGIKDRSPDQIDPDRAGEASLDAPEPLGELDKYRFPRPDLTQMTPFRPEPTRRPEAPEVDLLMLFVSFLPPAPAWQGPIVDPDQFILMMKELPLPPPPSTEPPAAVSAPAPAAAAPAAPSAPGRKRRADDEEEEPEPAAGSAAALPPGRDVFRKRQLLKLQQKR